MDFIRAALVDLGEISNSPPPQAPTPPAEAVVAESHGEDFPLGESYVQLAAAAAAAAAPLHFADPDLHPDFPQPVYPSADSVYERFLPFHASDDAWSGGRAFGLAAAPLDYDPRATPPAAAAAYQRPVEDAEDPADPTNAAPPKNPRRSKKKTDSQQDKDRPYIKKPRNAYICFVDEQRRKVAAELNNTNNSAVNAVLGQRWRNLSKEEQAKYYRQAARERQLHDQQHPDWSCKDNYGKKRKRQKRAAAAAAAPVHKVRGHRPQPKD